MAGAKRDVLLRRGYARRIGLLDPPHPGLVELLGPDGGFVVLIMDDDQFTRLWGSLSSLGWQIESTGLLSSRGNPVWMITPWGEEG